MLCVHYDRVDYHKSHVSVMLVEMFFPLDLVYWII